MNFKVYCALMGLAFAEEETYDLEDGLDTCLADDGACADEVEACTAGDANEVSPYGCEEHLADIMGEIVEDLAETAAADVEYANCFVDDLVDKETAWDCVDEIVADYV